MHLPKKFITHAITVICLLGTTIHLMAQVHKNQYLYESQKQLKTYTHLAQSKVMVLGTHHFNSSALDSVSQASILRLTKMLAKFEPTKIVLEWEPRVSEKANQNFNAYLKDSFLIQNKHNEVYQLGFRLAKIVEHDRLYFFDDQTPFIGSLEGFSFEEFRAYAETNDKGFYDKYLKDITTTYNHNETVFDSLTLLNQIALRNSPIAQRINSQRMHSFEIRVGIQKNWIGPDWLGRWYTRNVRMLANVIKMNQQNDRILIIVGDNHKWTLDELFKNTPEFELLSSWDFLNAKLK